MVSPRQVDVGNLVGSGENRLLTTELGQLEEGMRAIVSGLQPGERYIVNGLQRARPGLPVTSEMATSAGAQRETSESPKAAAVDPPRAPGG